MNLSHNTELQNQYFNPRLLRIYSTSQLGQNLAERLKSHVINGNQTIQEIKNVTVV